MDRRTAVLALLAWGTAPALAAKPKCRGLDHFLNRAIEEQNGIDPWLRTAGYTTMPMLEQALDSVALKAAKIASADAADTVDLWQALSQLSTDLLAVFGVAGENATTPMYVSGFATSPSLIIMQVSPAPVEAAKLEFVTIDSAAKIELLLNTFGAKNFTLAYRAAKSDLGGSGIEFLMNAYTWARLLARGEGSDKLAKSTTSLKEQALKLRQDITPMREPGTLKAMRIQQLQKLRERLGANIEKCDLMVSPPG